MEVVFYFSCPSEVSFEKKLAEIMVETCREVMPDSRIVQLTDLFTESIEGVDETVRFEPVGGLTESKATAFSLYECGEALYVDCDIVFLRDVSEVWEQDFDFAVKQTNSDLKISVAPHLFDPDKPVAEKMPYNTGVIFSRDYKVWHEVVKVISQISEKNWYDEQIAFGVLMKDYKVLDLEERYNYTPQYFLEDISGNSLVHFKGVDRKRWMIARYGYSRKSLSVITKISPEKKVSDGN